MNTPKISDFAPWQHKEEEEFDKIPMVIHRSAKESKSSNVTVSANDSIEHSCHQPSIKLSQYRQQPARRQLSYRQRSSQGRAKMQIKPVELSSIVGIGREAVGEIATAKRKMQGKMIEYLLLVYLAEELRQQASVEKNQFIKQTYECLFPLIRITGTNKDVYRNKKTLNDLINSYHL